MVEQGTHKPLVVGSNPTLAIFVPHLAVLAAQRRIYRGNTEENRHAKANHSQREPEAHLFP